MRSVLFLCLGYFPLLVASYFTFRTEKEESVFIERQFKPIRIRMVVSDAFKAAYNSEQMAVLEEAFNETLNFLQTTIRVRRLKIPIDLQSYNCFNYTNFPLDSDWLKKGVLHTDLIIFVDSKHTASCSNPDITLAFAATCPPKLNFINRPVFGYVAICRNSTAAKQWNVYSISNTVIHEILHVMVFNDFSMHTITTMIHNAYNSFGIEQQWKVNDNVTVTQQTNFVSTPRVLKFVREHFNCPDLIGAQLEDNGGPGTIRSHWKKRLFGNEIMTGKLSNQIVLSPLTSAFMEDSGWYMVNYSNVGQLEYGKGAGCTFAQKSCSEYVDSVKDEPFAAYPYCNWADFVTRENFGATKLARCTKDRTRYIYCNFVVNKSISDKYGYFRDKTGILDDGEIVSGVHVTGGEELFNHCPVWQELQWKWWQNHFEDSICHHTIGDTNPDLNFGAESRGPNTICVEQISAFAILRSMGFSIFSFSTTAYDTKFGAGCYRYKCYKGRLMLHAASNLMDTIPQAEYKICWYAGALLRFARHFRSNDGRYQVHRGSLICPPCEEICTKNDKNFQCEPDIIGIESRDLMLPNY